MISFISFNIFKGYLIGVSVVIILLYTISLSPLTREHSTSTREYAGQNAIPWMVHENNNSHDLGPRLGITNFNRLENTSYENTTNANEEDRCEDEVSNESRSSVENAVEDTSTDGPIDNVRARSNVSNLPVCPDDIENGLRGRIPVVQYPVPTIAELESKFDWLTPGGHWQPNQCLAPERVAVVVPFRCRGRHLRLFLNHMHPFLRRQKLNYSIVVVEQDGEAPFNRAMLMNVGYAEAMKMGNYDCFVFHDVDLLPEDDRNIYSCPVQPRHMSVSLNVFKYKVAFPFTFGGVSGMTRHQFELVNGFSNSFWGWGGEDDDMFNRILHQNLYVSKYVPTIARYTMLNHIKKVPNPNRFETLKRARTLYDIDGLNTLKYEVTQIKQNLLYTWILAKIEQPKG